jgi:hypothetical protein
MLLKIKDIYTFLYSTHNSTYGFLAEREGFEPPIRLPVCRISSAVHSTALPPLQAFDLDKFY